MSREKDLGIENWTFARLTDSPGDRREETMYRELGRVYDLVSLRTNSAGHRSLADCQADGLAFYTGLAGNCFIGAFVHDRTGMAAAHVGNLSDIQLRHYVRKFFEIPHLDTLHRSDTLADFFNEIFPLAYNLDLLHVTIETARQEFLKLAGGYPEGTKLVVAGGKHLRVDVIQTLTKAAHDYLADECPGAELIPLLGEARGLVFAPEGHPRFAARLGQWDIADYAAIM